jgi:hypothetical protein
LGRKKYKIDGSIRSLKQKPSNSPMWNNLVKIKDIYLKGRIISIGNGRKTDFWEDSCCGSVSLKEKFKNPFDICEEQNKNVAWLVARGWRLNFQRWLDERAQNQLRQLRDTPSTCALSMEEDTFRWMWDKSGKYSMNSLYSHLYRMRHKNLTINMGIQNPIEKQNFHVVGGTKCHPD